MWTACNAHIEPLPLEAARVPLFVEIRKGQHPNLDQLPETIIDNNIYITDVAVNCLDGTILPEC